MTDDPAWEIPAFLRRPPSAKPVEHLRSERLNKRPGENSLPETPPVDNLEDLL